MANTFYLGSSGTAAVSPSFSSDWDITSEAIRRPLSSFPRDSTMTTKSYDDADETDQSILFFQFVGNPMNATASGTPSLTINMRCSETSTDNNLFLCATARLVRENGSDYSTPKVLSTFTIDNTECDTVLTSRSLTLGAITSTDIAEGDRLVLEIGLTGDPSPGGSHDGSISYGDDSATDISIISDSTTAANNPIANLNTSSYTFQGTRLYLPSDVGGAAAAVTPSDGDVWDDVAQKVGVLATQFTPSGSTMTSYNIEDADVNQRAILIMTYVTPPLNPFTTDELTSTLLDLTIRGLETSASNNLVIATTIRAVQNDGTDYVTPKYILGSDTTTKNTGEVNATTLTSASWGSTVYSSGISIAEGDRLVIEIGMSGNPATTFSHDGTISLGDDAASDLTNGTTDTDADNPWIQLAGSGSNYLPFKRDAGPETYFEAHNFSVTCSSDLLRQLSYTKVMAASCANVLDKSTIYPQSYSYSMSCSSSLDYVYVQVREFSYSMTGTNVLDVDFTPTREPSMSSTCINTLGRTIHVTKSVGITCGAGLSHRIYPDFFETPDMTATCTVGFNKELITSGTISEITDPMIDRLTDEITQNLTNPH